MAVVYNTIPLGICLCVGRKGGLGMCASRSESPWTTLDWTMVGDPLGRRGPCYARAQGVGESTMSADHAFRLHLAPVARPCVHHTRGL